MPLLVSHFMIDDIAHLGLLDDDEILLDEAALELSALDHPGVSLDGYLDQLGEIAEDLVARGSSADTPVERARVLAEVIGGDHGFRGDREAYDDTSNADMMDVIDRRRGLPVSLSIIYVALARRAGWDAEALNTPGHVVVSLGIGADGLPVLIDPFNGGNPIDTRQLASLLSGMLGRGITPAPEHLAAMSNRAVLVRLLLNQATRAEQAERIGRARMIHERITTVAPAYAHSWWERARIELVTGDVPAARASLSAMLETTRDPALRMQVSAALDALAGR